jgi:hypothetical protein
MKNLQKNLWKFGKPWHLLAAYFGILITASLIIKSFNSIS